jgi:hypothetical protein
MELEKDWKSTFFFIPFEAGGGTLRSGRFEVQGGPV